MSKPLQPPQRKLCPTCGKPLVVREQKDARSKLYCPSCEGPDPLYSPKAIGWAKSSLHPPRRAR